ncbi:flavin reductase family protein [Actinomycetospora aeridis]|uniref:Flavin reductase family protein n=1 Tax=Actinomycetospora aeridis TaxID=3129231 RepID=A0ABU8N0B9_9PSEU
MRPTGPTGLTDPEEIARSLRAVMGSFATGVTVLTTPGPDGHGMTANAVTSVSLDPPLVLACVARTSRIHAAIERSGALGVSVLGGDQVAAAHWFADKGRPSGARQFDAVDHALGAHTAAPLITGALGWLECRVVTTHDGGDHAIVVGEVLAADTGADDADPALLFHRGRFGRQDPPAPLLRAA